MEKLELEDFLNYRMLSGPRFSPDGSHAAFVVKQAKEEINGYDSSIWLYERETQKIRQLTNGGKDTLFLWDGNETLLFLSGRDAKPAFYRINIYGGEAVQAFPMPLKALDVRSLGAGRILISAREDCLYPDAWQAEGQRKEEIKKEQEENQDYQVIDEIPFWWNGKGFINKKRDGLFLCDTETGKLEKITPDDTDVRFYTVFGDRVIYSGCGFATDWSGYQPLYQYDASSGETTCVYEADDFRCRGLAPFGSRLIMKASDRKSPYGSMYAGEFYEVDLERHKVSLFSESEITLGSMVGSDCKMGAGCQWKAGGDFLYFIGTVENEAAIFALSGDGTCKEVFRKPGSIECFDLTPDGRTMLAVCMYDNRLEELYEISCDGSGCAKRSSFNDSVLERKYVADYQKLTVSSQGRRIDGFVLLPRDFKETESYPAILDIHGGPRTTYGEVFYHEMQYWANEGYFVFFCNPVGSDGRGFEFAHIYGRVGGEDYENIMDFTDAVLEKYPQIDRKRLGVTGGSYGGFMTNWIVGHTDRFACAASQRSISNWISFYGMSDIGWWTAWEHTGADMYEDVERVWERSPLKYANQVKTPMLFIHSEEDYRCPMAEGMQMMTAVAKQGVPVRMCLFKGENHELSRSGKPRHRVRRLQEITAWMDKYLR